MAFRSSATFSSRRWRSHGVPRFRPRRLTGAQGLIVERKLADLTEHRNRGSTKGDKIPSLQGFLSQIAKRVPLVIEIKSKFDGDLRLTKRVCEILADYHGPFVVKSFDPVIVGPLRTLAPQHDAGHHRRIALCVEDRQHSAAPS